MKTASIRTTKALRPHAAVLPCAMASSQAYCVETQQMVSTDWSRPALLGNFGPIHPGGGSV